MDPHEDELQRRTRKMLLETDARLRAGPAWDTLKVGMRQIEQIVEGKLPIRRSHAKDADSLWQDVDTSKSSAVAGIARKLFDDPKKAAATFGGVALAGYLLNRFRRKTTRRRR